MASELHDIAHRHHIPPLAHQDRKVESTFRECAIGIRSAQRDAGQRLSGWEAAPLAGVLLDLSPTEAPWRVRQSLPFTHMLDLPGGGAKDVQLLVVTAHRGMCAGLVLLPLDHERPYRKSRARVLICIKAMWPALVVCQPRQDRDQGMGM